MTAETRLWQPMDTAPTDRNVLLVREAGGGKPRTVTFGYWHTEEHGPQLGDCGGVCHCPEYDEPCEPFWYSEDGSFSKDSPPVAWAEVPEPPDV